MLLSWSAATKTVNGSPVAVNAYRPREAGVVLATLGPGVLSYDDTSPTNGAGYDVIADFADGTSVTSNVVTYSGGTPTFTGPTPTIDFRVVGPTGKVNTGHPTAAGITSVRLMLATDAAMTSGITYTTPVSLDANGTAKHNPGVTSGTRFYRVLVTTAGGEGIDTQTAVGRIAFTPAEASSVTWTSWSCHNSTSEQTVHGRIAAHGDTVDLCAGDWFYDDAAASDQATIRSRIRAKLALSNWHLTYARTRLSYVPSDHDAAENNGTAGNDPTGWANYNAAYRELIPVDVPASGVYHYFDEGFIRHIALDTRSFKTITSATDDANKRCLGATQETWLQTTLTQMPVGMLAVINVESPWIGAAVAGDDDWRGYTTERARVGAMLEATGRPYLLWHGDSHFLAYDNGTNNPAGTAPVYCTAPANNNASQKPSAAAYSGSGFPASGTTVVQQYGRWTATKTGTQVSVQMTGYNGAGTVVYGPTTAETFEVGSSSPSGQSMPVGNLGADAAGPEGWTQVYAEDFGTDVPEGSMQSDPAYSGIAWYPDTWTNNASGTPGVDDYTSWYGGGKTARVSGSVMRQRVHTDADGKHRTETPQPLAARNRTYGRYAVRWRIPTELPGYKIAWLWWPRSDVWNEGELNFPETGLRTTSRISAYAHYKGAPTSQTAFDSNVSPIGAWHTTEMIWSPGRVEYILDGVTLGVATTAIPDTPFDWRLQTEGNLSGTASNTGIDPATTGDIEIDWLVAYTRNPVTPDLRLSYVALTVPGGT